LNKTKVSAQIIDCIDVRASYKKDTLEKLRCAQDTDFDFEQRHSNECSGATFCANEGSIEFTPLE
jgi:hypothetical protein